MSTVTLSQRHQALEKANEVRTAAREFKERLAALERREAVLEAARVLVKERDCVGAVKVHVLLEAVPRLGSSKVERILKRHGIWPLRPVGALTERCCSVLAAELMRHAEGLGRYGRYGC